MEESVGDSIIQSEKSSKLWLVILIVIILIIIFGIIFFKFSLTKKQLNSNDLVENETRFNSIEDACDYNAKNLVEQFRADGKNISYQTAKDECFYNSAKYSFERNPEGNFTDICQKIQNFDARGYCMMAISGRDLPKIKYYPVLLNNTQVAGFGNFGDTLITQKTDDKNKTQGYGYAWISFGTNFPKYARGVSFNAEFFDSNLTAQGLLTVYLNSVEIGIIDERVASSGSQQYKFFFDSAKDEGIYALGFRLDTFNNITSEIKITNISIETVNA